MSRLDPDHHTDLLRQAIEQLHRSVGSIGDVAFCDGAGGLSWVVSGTNGENRIVVGSGSAAEAWVRAVQQARSLGMLGK